MNPHRYPTKDFRSLTLTGLLLLSLSLCACPGEKEETLLDKPKPASTQEPTPARDSITAVPTGTKPQNKGPMLRMDLDELRLVLVRPGGSAAKAGFKSGDRLLAADGKDLGGEDDLAKALIKAGKQKIFFEVRRDKSIETLPMEQTPPGWLMLSGDSFNGFLVSRVRNPTKPKRRDEGEPAKAMNLPGYAQETIQILEKPTKPTAILFWGTFAENGDKMLAAFAQACKAAGESTNCVLVDTMELFTAVRKTKDFAVELARIHQDLWPGPMAVDLFMEADRHYGIAKLPTLIRIGIDGKINLRIDGPQTDYTQAYGVLAKP